MFYFFFWFFKNCELIKDSFLWRSNFIPSVHDSIIIIGSRSVTYTFGSRFIYKYWVRVSIKNLNFSFLGQVFQYYLLGLKARWLRFASLGQLVRKLGHPYVDASWQALQERLLQILQEETRYGKMAKNLYK